MAENNAQSRAQTARRERCDFNNKELLEKFRNARANFGNLVTKKQKIKSRSGVPGNTVYELAQNSVGSIACFGVADADCGSALSTGSCFITTHPDRMSTLILTAAHIAIPDFMRVNAANNPYLLTDPVNTPSSKKQWGVTTLNEWPYQYICDLYNDDTGKREFFYPELLGVDWHSDLAVFELYESVVGATFLPMELATDEPKVGDELFALNNLWSMDLTDMAIGTVRQQNFQPNGLLLPAMTTTVDLGSGSSGSAYLVPNPVDPDTMRPQIVGMFTASIKQLGITYTTGSSLIVLTDALNQIITGINFSDLQSILAPPPSGEVLFSIIMSISRFDLGLTSDVLQVDDLNLMQALPVNAGYVYHDSLPFGPVQSIIKPRDLILSLETAMSPGEQELGIYDYQFSMFEAIASATSLTKLNILRWGAGGYNPTPFVLTDLELRNQTANSWTWWFQWLLPPYGAAIDFDMVDPTTFSAIVNDTVARQQWRRIVNLGTSFSALNNESLRPEAEVSTEQTSRIEAIINEVTQQLDVFALATGELELGPRRTGKIVGARRTGKIVGARRTGKIVGARRTGKIVGARRTGKIVGARRTGKIVGARRTGKIVGGRRTGKIVGGDFDDDEFDDEEYFEIGFAPGEVVDE